MNLDLIVTPLDDGAVWALEDLLGRSMGRIASTSAGAFTIHPDGPALDVMAEISAGPYASLDDALAEIEKHTRGTCRRPPGQDQP